MQNDIVKPPKELQGKPNEPLAAPAQPVVAATPETPKEPTGQSGSDSASTDPKDTKEVTPQPEKAPKVHKSSGMTPVILITALVCLALVGLAVYMQIR